MYLLRTCGLYKLMLLPLHRFRIHRTPCKMQGIRKCLIIGNALVMTHVKASVMTENTGTDIVLLSIHQLRYPFLVCQELTGKPGTVKPAIPDRICCHTGIHTSCTHHRNIHELTDMLHILKVTVFRHINRGMCPIPGIVGSIVAVEHVISGILQIFNRLLRLCHITSGFHILFPRQCSLAEALGLRFHAVP